MMDTSNLQAMTMGESNRLAPLLGDVRSQYDLGFHRYYDPTALQTQLDRYTGLNETQYQQLQPYLGGLKSVADIEGLRYFDKAALSGIDFANFSRQPSPTSKTDLTGAQFGIGGYRAQDIGSGKYNILGSDDSVLGVGYKSPLEAAKELIRENALKSVAEGEGWTPAGDSDLEQFRTNLYGVSDPARIEDWGFSPVSTVSKWYDLPEGFREAPGGIDQFQKRGQGFVFGENAYSTKEEAEAAARAFASQMPTDYQGGIFADWELLGQALSGASSFPEVNEWGSLPLNKASEKITGENTLYGSVPVFSNGELIGYKTDMTPGETSSRDWSGGQGKAVSSGTGYTSKYDGKSHAWATGLGRELLDPQSYASNVQAIDESGNVFIPLDNASKMSGWSNLEGFNHQDKQYGGLLHEVFKFVDPILDKIDPLHNPVQKALFNADTTEEQSPYFQQYLPQILSYFFPAVGAAVGAIDGASRGDPASVASNAAGYLIPTDWGTGSKAANAALTAGAKAGTSAAFQGQDLEDIARAALIAGAIGGVSSGAGSALRGSELYQTANPLEQAILRGGASAGVSGLSSALQGQDVRSGLTQGAISGASGVLQSTVDNYLKENFPDLAGNTQVINQILPLLLRQMAQRQNRG